MKLNVRAFAHAIALVWTALYSVCALLVAVAPTQTTAAFGYVLHSDFSPIMRSVSWIGFFVGLVCWYLLVAVSAGAGAALYNRLAQDNTDKAVFGVPKAPYDTDTTIRLPSGG